MSKHGTFAWFELVTTDSAAGVAFWSEVAGLGTETMPMGDGHYTMLKRGDTTFAGVVAPQMPGVPNHWASYWGVDDVDARTARVPAAGGQVLVPPTDIPTVGRFSIVADPHGATIALFKSASDAPEAAAPVMGWVELWSPDAAAALKFYVEVLELGTRVMDTPSGPYHLLTVGDHGVAGVMTSPDPKVPAMWLPYVTVDDADDAATRVKNHGGAVHVEPMTMPGVGRFGVVADRQGAVLGVLAPERR